VSPAPLTPPTKYAIEASIVAPPVIFKALADIEFT
jgi:hypothetical protein